MLNPSVARTAASLFTACLLIAGTTPHATASITEIIDTTGDGAGNGLGSTEGIVVDRFRSAYVVGFGSSNVFRNALAAWTFNRSAATMTITLYRASVGFNAMVRITSRIWAIVITRILDSGLTHCTSG